MSFTVSPSPAASLVQEIATSLTVQQIPEKFLYKNGYPSTDSCTDYDLNSLWMNDLLIDFSLLSAPSTDPAAREELGKLRSALCSWGCFQLKNHGIEKELLDRILEVSREFFELPLEERQKCAGTDPFSGYGNDARLAGTRSLNWNDRLYLRDCSEDANNLASWPENPPQFRELYGNYLNKLRTILPQVLVKAMARSLDLDEDCLLRQYGGQGSLTGRVNIYPRCPDPEHVLGLRPHGDGSIFSVILQDRKGLQVMKDNQWFPVPVIPGVLFVNVGDIMEIMSNGVIKSAFHRVVTSSEYERITLSMSYNPCNNRVIKPVDELVTPSRPQAFKETTMRMYGEAIFNCHPPGERTLHAFKL